MRTLAGRNLPLLQRNLKDMPPDVQTHARQVLALKKSILDCFHRLLDLKITGMRTRCHGDYHLGQVLYTGKDFVIIDFEGEPARPIGERRIKRSPLRDVAGMLRSFHYAAYAALIELEKQGIIRPDELPWLESWANYWSVWVSAVFLKSYLAIAADAHLIPAAGQEVKILLDALLLEKAVYELGYELNNRPGWVKIPIQGIRQLSAVRKTGGACGQRRSAPGNLFCPLGAQCRPGERNGRLQRMEQGSSPPETPGPIRHLGGVCPGARTGRRVQISHQIAPEQLSGGQSRSLCLFQSDRS